MNFLISILFLFSNGNEYLFCPKIFSIFNEKMLHLEGQKFGRLTALERAGSRRKPSGQITVLWLCQCECGNKFITSVNNLRSGDTKSCGCLNQELIQTRRITHGHTKYRSQSPEYIAWQGMRDRCINPLSNVYKYYGGRGINICPRWFYSFEQFFGDMGEKPSTKHSLDRIDVNGDYEPSNCRWASQIEQAQNKRNNHWIEYNGEKKILAEWARYFGVTSSTLQSRMRYQSFDYLYDFYNKKKNLIT